MICLATVISTVELLMVILVLAVGAKLASRYYQRHMYGAADEEVAINWQNRVVLLGIVFGLLKLLSHIQFSVVPD